MTTQPTPQNEPYESLRLERDGARAEVVLRALGPAGKGKSTMGPAFFRELPAVFEELDREPATRVVIVRGEGGHFSYGLDLVAMAPMMASFATGGLAAERLRLLDLVHELQRSFDVVASCRKPVIAAVSGWCIGGGLDLAAACDIRLASADARFSLREVKVAMVADLGSLQRLPHIIGQGHLRELAFTGKNIDAARALRIGLVNDVYDGEGALLAAARALAGEIAESSPLVVRGVKQVLNEGDGKSVREGLAHVALWNAAFLASNDLGEAFAAFAAKRPPKYEGR